MLAHCPRDAQRARTMMGCAVAVAVIRARMLHLPDLSVYFSHHNVLVLSSSGPSGPHATPLFYAVLANATLVWVSDPKTLHGQHCADGASVSIAVAPSSQPVRSVQGVQARGRVCVGEDQAALRRAYVQRYPASEPFIDPSHRFYLFQPTWARLVRVRDGVRHRSEWRAG